MTPEKIPLLVVEDEPLIQSLIRILLEGSAYEVTAAESLLAAIHVLAQSRFDVILCDLSLPDSQMNETVSVMAQMARGAKVVVMTGWDDEAIFQMCRRQGAVKVFQKGATYWCLDLVSELDRIRRMA